MSRSATAGRTVGLASGRRARAALATALAGLASLGSLLGGCTSEQAFADLREENVALQERVVSLSQENSALRNAQGLSSGEFQRKEDLILTLQQTNRSMQDELARLQGEYRSLEERLMGVQLTSAVDPQTDRALRQLADAYPDLLGYDSATGMLRFTSDLTFGSGSDTVEPKAKEALRTLASVLTSVGMAYDVRVVGHTDSQQISDRNKARFPSNRHLSCARAIAVQRELSTLGVPAGRVLAAGWGEERPLVPNSPTGNTPQNRRVEIFLNQSTSGAGPMMQGSAVPVQTPATRPAASVREEIIK